MPTLDLPSPSAYAVHWRLDPDVVFLNHGSFGAVPCAVALKQRAIQDMLHREPIRFFVEEVEPMLDEARRVAAAFVGCDPEDFAFVLNATMGVNTVVRSLKFERGDEIITSAQEYNACNNVLLWAEEQWGTKTVFAPIPFPMRSSDEAYETVLSAVTARTKLVLLSHITSPTGVVLPVEKIIAELNRRSVDTLVDTAHGPGMLPLKVASMGGGAGPAYCTGNFHKWVSAPTGAAFLYVRKDRQQLMRPQIISHGANSKRTDRSRFRLEFDYLGTIDVSPWLCVPEAIRFGASLLPGGWPEVMRRNHELALAGRELLCRRFGVGPPAPADMIGTMATIRIPDRMAAEANLPTKYHDGLQDLLIARHRIQVPIIPFPAAPTRYVRIAAAMYNTIEQFEYLAGALETELGRLRG